MDEPRDDDSNSFAGNYLLFAAFTLGWVLSWCYSYRASNGDIHAWGNSESISNAHSIPLTVAAVLSILELIPEIIPVAYSTSFFLVDIVDAVLRRDAMFGVHAALSLLLNMGASRNVKHRQMRNLSKGYLCELSTPWLNKWKRSHTKKDYLVFFAAFTFSRIVWVPLFVYDVYKVIGVDSVICASAAFYLLQFAWYIKMIAILANYKVPSERKTKEKSS